MAVIGGSRAYGTPREDSDVDMVILVSQEDLALLMENFDNTKVGATEPTPAYANEAGTSLRVGNLNLIVTTNPEVYALWEDGINYLKSQKPVTREFAVGYLSGMRQDYFGKK